MNSSLFQEEIETAIIAKPAIVVAASTRETVSRSTQLIPDFVSVGFVFLSSRRLCSISDREYQLNEKGVRTAIAFIPCMSLHFTTTTHIEAQYMIDLLRK
jgi:hypothetical protein